MIFLWVLLVALQVENSQGISIQVRVNPFTELIVDLLANCLNHETIFFYGNVKDQVVKDAMDHHRKILPLNGRIENITTSERDLLVVFLDEAQGWKQQIAGAFLRINTVFVLVGAPQLYQAKTIFADFWTASESTNVFVCSETEDGRSLVILTYNPYSDYAPPEFWRRTDGMFVGRYSPGRRTDCSSLLFDRTKNLENYPIQALQFLPATWMQSSSGSYLISKNYALPRMISHPYLYFIVSSLIRSLSVSINLTNLIREPEYTSSILISFSFSKSLDMKIQPSSVSNTTVLSYYDLSYPFLTFQDVIVTHRLGLMTPLEKMFNFYGWLTIVATLIIISAAFLVIYLSNNLVLSFSIFDSLRLIINIGINSRMESTKSRIFFSMIFLYFLVIQATFSGHLAAFLTKPEYRKNVEDLDGLKDSRYQVIYAHPAAESYITDESLRAKTFFGNYLCNTDTINNPRAACVENYGMVNYLVVEYDLHKAKNPLLTKFSGFLLRKDWRLKDRVNLVIARIVDSGLNFKKANFSGWKIKRYFSLLQDRLGPNYYRPIEFQDLLFIFVLLSVGLLVAILAFLAELIFQGWKDYHKGIRKRWRAAKRVAKIFRRMIFFKIRRWWRTAWKNPRLRG